MLLHENKGKKALKDFILEGFFYACEKKIIMASWCKTKLV